MLDDIAYQPQRCVLEAGRDYVKLIVGKKVAAIVAADGDYKLTIDKVPAEITVHQLHVLADWLRIIVERELAAERGE